MQLKTINPYTLREIQTYQTFSNNEIDKVIENSDVAFNFWKGEKIEKRCSYINNLSNVLINNAEQLAILAANEMGKPITDGINEVKKCASLCNYYAKNSKKFIENHHIKTEMEVSYVTFQPLGVILIIMPWNYPFWQVFRAAIPAIAAGNTVILKHAPNTTGCSIKIEKVFIEAGFPQNIFSSIIVDIEQIPQIIESYRIKGVALTGSAKAGSAVAQLAGKNLKKCVLELGGSDPYIVLSDADQEKAAKQIVFSRMLTSGQTCISAKRIIVIKEIAENFIRLLTEEFKKIHFGNPIEANTKYGPLARKDIYERIDEQVKKSLVLGAKCIYQGEVPTENSLFYPVTLLMDVKEGMPAYDEELFGPVAVLFIVENEDEAINLANATKFGLGSAVYTKNFHHGQYIAEHKLNAGISVVNDFVRSDPRLPFGGINQSGFGRELSPYGIMEFVNVKIYIRKRN